MVPMGKALIFSIVLLLQGVAWGIPEEFPDELERAEDVEDFEEVRNPSPPTDNADSDFSQDITLGLPSYAGTGCPAGTLSSTLSPDKKALSLIFDQYIVEAGGASGLAKNRKVCQLLIPFHIPRGFRVTVVRIDFRGFHIIPAEGKTAYATSFQFQRRHRPDNQVFRVMRKKVFHGPLDQEYTLISKMRQGRKWTKCGEGFNLEVKTRAVAVSNPQRENVFATIDSADLVEQGHLQYHLRWKRCSQGPGD